MFARMACSCNSLYLGLPASHALLFAPRYSGLASLMLILCIVFALLWAVASAGGIWALLRVRGTIKATGSMTRPMDGANDVSSWWRIGASASQPSESPTRDGARTVCA